VVVIHLREYLDASKRTALPDKAHMNIANPISPNIPTVIKVVSNINNK
jgi:hypothetical protein